MVSLVVPTHPVLRSDWVGSLWRDCSVCHQLSSSLQLLVNLPVGGLVVLLHYGLLLLVVARGTNLVIVISFKQIVMLMVILKVGYLLM